MIWSLTTILLTLIVTYGVITLNVIYIAILRISTYWWPRPKTNFRPSEPPGWKTKCLVSTSGADIVESSCNRFQQLQESRDWACVNRLSRANAKLVRSRGDRLERGLGAYTTTPTTGWAKQSDRLTNKHNSHTPDPHTYFWTRQQKTLVNPFIPCLIPHVQQLRRRRPPTATSTIRLERGQHLPPSSLHPSTAPIRFRHHSNASWTSFPLQLLPRATAARRLQLRPRDSTDGYLDVSPSTPNASRPSTSPTSSSSSRQHPRLQSLEGQSNSSSWEPNFEWKRTSGRPSDIPPPSTTSSTPPTRRLRHVDAILRQCSRHLRAETATKRMKIGSGNS